MSAARREFLWLLLALLSLLICLVRPSIPLPRPVFHYLFVLDITQSMNARDYSEKGLPADRFSFAKQALRRAIRDLPCGSRAALGLFSTKDVLILLEPLEICNHFSVLDDTITHIDWRMAWAADSNVERGLYAGMLSAKKLGKNLHLVFLSDGEQSIQELHRPPLARIKGSVKGFVFGTGTLNPTPIPKLDPYNQAVGYWSRGEVDDYPIGAPMTSTPAPGDPEAYYLSRLNQSNLETLAALSGLQYDRLQSPAQFVRRLQNPELAKSRPVPSDIRWIFALIALGSILRLCHFPRIRLPRKRRGA